MLPPFLRHLMLSATLAGLACAQSPPGCTITSPPPGSVVSGDVPFDIDLVDPDMDPLALIWEYSTDLGITFSPATAAALSPLPNPALGLAPGSYTFVWGSCIDVPADRAPVMIRTAVDDGLFVATCSVLIDVHNDASCSITSPLGGTHSGVIPITFTSSAACGTIVSGAAWYSTDSGMTWSMATPQSGSSPFPLAAGPASFAWDSAADIQTSATGVVVAINVMSTVTSSGCETVIDVDNAQCLTFCGDCDTDGVGPTVNDAFAAARIAVVLLTPTAQQQRCCDVDSSGVITAIDAFLIAHAALGLPVALTCP